MTSNDSLAGLRGRMEIATSAWVLARRLTDDIIAALHNRLHLAGTAHLALSGGSSPRELYRLLAETNEYAPRDWARTHLWLVDERCVPPGDERLNFRWIASALVSRVPIPESHVHPMPAIERDGDRQYESELRRLLVAAGGRLDVALMGIGRDCHTASLFPHSPALDEEDRWVVFNDGAQVQPPRPRMTLTYPVLCAARFLPILVTGADKHEALLQAAKHPDDKHGCPVCGLVPSRDTQLVWYLDRAAATGSDEPVDDTPTPS